MPGGSPEPVGPFPDGADPDAYDRRRRRILWAMPSGLYVLGTQAEGRRNLMTLNWAMQVAIAPKLVAVSVEVAAVSHQLLHEGRAFSLNVLPRSERAIVRKFVKPLPDDGDLDVLAGHALVPGLGGPPVLAVAAAWLRCDIRQEVPGGSHTIFVGEVVDCGGDPSDDLEVLRMEDTRMSYGG